MTTGTSESTQCCIGADYVRAWARPEGGVERAVSVVVNTAMIGLGVYLAHRFMLQGRRMPTSLAHVVKVGGPTLAVLAMHQLAASRLPQKKIIPEDQTNTITQLQADKKALKQLLKSEGEAKLKAESDLLAYKEHVKAQQEKGQKLMLGLTEKLKEGKLTEKDLKAVGGLVESQLDGGGFFAWLWGGK